MKQRLLSIVLALIYLALGHGGSVMALSTSDRSSLYGDSVYYWPAETDAACNPDGVGPTSPTQTSADQKANALAIIGIAKTENLGQKGALIGLMTGIAESGLQTYANSNVPLSLTLPHQKVGSDHDSLGVFQQRISTGWSTIASDPNNAAAVQQLMNGAYNAEAFFGSPPGSNAPPALSKGLQNHDGWSTKDPWVAAQDTQVSAYDGNPRAANNYSSVYGGNYKDAMASAQSLLSQYYDSAPAVALPVSFTASSASTANTGDSACGGSSTIVTADDAPAYCKDGSATGNERIVCSAWIFDPYAYDAPGHRGDAAYTKQLVADVKSCEASNFGSGCKYPKGSLMVDCSGMVDAAIYDALGVDMDGAATPSYPSNPHLHEIPLNQAQPGDIAWWTDNGTADGHTEVIVSYDAAANTFHTFGAHENHPDVDKDISPATYAGSGGGWAVQRVYRVTP